MGAGDNGRRPADRRPLRLRKRGEFDHGRHLSGAGHHDRTRDHFRISRRPPLPEPSQCVKRHEHNKKKIIMTHHDVTLVCDLLVVGSGAAGLSTAVTAASLGLDVIVVEKEPQIGGTTAWSGGWLWIPRNPSAIA